MRRPRRTRFLLIAVGVALGYFARLVLGPPASEAENPNRFESELPVERAPGFESDSEFDLKILKDDNAQSGIVPAIQLVEFVDVDQSPNFKTDFEPVIEHGESAEFEPHGEQVCASGCALSRHPTGELTHAKFQDLVTEFRQSPFHSENQALEELLFYGPQTAKHLSALDPEIVDHDAIQRLVNELQKTHARISLRVIDQTGKVRTWLEPTSVPLDRRHVFTMETKNLQPLVTSGTVKRVGLEHLWVRL